MLTSAFPSKISISFRVLFETSFILSELLESLSEIGV